MNTKTLSPRALSVIEQYLHFKAGSAVCSVPYFNNKTLRLGRGALPAYIGKGSPKEIFEEIETMLVKDHIAAETLADESLKKLLVDNAIGIDCSGFAFYVLNAESQENKKGSLDKHLSFIRCRGIVGRIICALRPARNTDVATLADDANSRIIALKDAQPGDFISMIGGPEGDERDHILVIHQAEYQNFAPTKIHYSHGVAYPEDGVYGSGIRQGTIEILDPAKGLLEARWIEDGKEAENNRIYVRAQRSQTGIRRLKWL